MWHAFRHASRDIGDFQDTTGCLITTCPPPDFTDVEWVDDPSWIPSEDELLLMDMSAEVLEADFIGDVS